VASGALANVEKIIIKINAEILGKFFFSEHKKIV